MAKTNRGKALRGMPTNARGECPVCGRQRTKLLYSFTLAGDEESVKVCKRCRNKDAEAIDVKSLNDLTQAQISQQKLVK